jgi:hypothetical protein
LEVKTVELSLWAEFEKVAPDEPNVREFDAFVEASRLFAVNNGMHAGIHAAITPEVSSRTARTVMGMMASRENCQMSVYLSLTAKR